MSHPSSPRKAILAPPPSFSQAFSTLAQGVEDDFLELFSRQGHRWTLDQGSSREEEFIEMGRTLAMEAAANGWARAPAPLSKREATSPIL